MRIHCSILLASVLMMSMIIPCKLSNLTQRCFVGPTQEINPFLTSFGKKSHLEVLKEPVKVEGLCGGLWAEKGTCCDPEKAKGFAVEQSKNIKITVDEYLSGIFDIVGDFEELFKKFDGLNNAKVFMKPLWANLMRKLEQMYKGDFRQTAAKMMLDRGTYTNSVKKCWETMNRIRSRSICYICSPESHIYFHKSHILVSEAVCNTIVGDCDLYFDVSLQIMEVLNDVTEDISASLEQSKKGVDKKIAKITNSMGKEIDAFENNSVLKSLKAYKLAGKLDSTEELSDLCGHLVRISKETFIEASADLFKQGRNIINKLNDRILKLIQKGTKNDPSDPNSKLVAVTINGLNPAKKTVSNWVFSSSTPPSGSVTGTKRLLQITSETSQTTQTTEVKTENILQGDVEMVTIKKVDSSYLSYVGAPGTAGHEVLTSDSKVAPFDLHSTFP